MHVLPWSLPLQILACAFHGVAIASTIFRLVYRWYMARFWSEDTWALFALIGDVLGLVCVWLEEPAATVQEMPPINRISIWIVVMTLPCVLWASRISILFSTVHVVNPSERLRRVAFFVLCAFIAMWAALMGQRIQICITDACVIGAPVAIPQLITDILSDVLLVVLPVYLLQRTTIRHRHRILLCSVFSATLLITAISVYYSVVLLSIQSTGTTVIAHVRAAISLIVCNLFVITTFVYRMCHRGRDPDVSDEGMSFTSVDLNTGLTEMQSAVERTVMERLDIMGS
ncbi:hypothetical protein EV363DRAFT_1394511 [Boletus edulis]|nr:hypothetical protein EV363DRAFT_1394511 [Boletus edulis]